MSRVLFSVWFRIQSIINKCPEYYSASGSVFSVLLKNVQGIIQSLVQDSAYYSEMSRVLFSVWFIIQRVIQGIIQNMTSVLFSVWFRIQGIIKKCPGYYSASASVFRVLFMLLFKIRPVYYSVPGSGFRVIKKCPGYYSASGSIVSVLFRVLFKIRPAYYSMPGSGFRVLLKNVQGIIQHLVQDSAYYLKMSRVLFNVWFSIPPIIQGIIQNTTSVLFSI